MKIFISYRREDSSGHTGRLRDRLAAEFGEDAVFYDLETIAPGESYHERIREAVASCDALLVVIGRRWLDAEAGGARRLEDPADLVRAEVAAALRRGVRVVPVLVQGAQMPRAADLPEEMREMASRQAFELSDTRWDYDSGQLISALRRPSDAHRARPHNIFKRRGVLVAVSLAAALSLAAYLARAYIFPPDPKSQDCWRQLSVEVPPDKVVTMKEGSSDFPAVRAGQPKGGAAAINFTASGHPVGGIAYQYFPDNKLFKVVRVYDANCRATGDFRNTSRPDIPKGDLMDWNTLELRLGENIYTLRLGDHGEAIYATFQRAAP